MDIEYMEPECTAEERERSEILIAENMICRKGELRQTVADILAVGFCALNALDDVAVLVVDQPFAVGRYVGILEHVEAADRTTFLNTLQWNIGISGFSVYACIIIVVTDEFRN